MMQRYTFQVFLKIHARVLVVHFVKDFVDEVDDIYFVEKYEKHRETQKPVTLAETMAILSRCAKSGFLMKL